MNNFNYDKAEADLYDSGCPYSEEIYGYTSEKGFDSFMRENGLDPEKYKNNSNSTNSNNNNEGCYLTTACVVAKNLPDDCDELQTLRNFRDNYLKKRNNGMQEVTHYYEMAPKIVQKINKICPNRWERIYQELIIPCVKMIKEEKFEEVYKHYKEYTLKLEEEFINKK